MDSKDISSVIAQFSARFCNELTRDKNVVSSPLSAEYVLALLTLGTSEPAHSELLTALSISDDDLIRSLFSDVTTKLKALQGVTLNVANKVYIMEGGYDLQSQLKEDAINIFDAEMEKIDFCKNVDAVGTINKWVEDKTNEKIKDLLSEDSVNGGTRLVLVNALYFKGTWKNQFDPSLTMEKPFFIHAFTHINIPMMYKEDTFALGYSQALQAQLLNIPYVGGNASMLIVLPQQIEGLDDVIAKLAAGHDLMADVNQMCMNKVQVTIPKFKIETEIDLKEVLPKLGIKAIFRTDNSCLTKLLNSGESLYVTKAVQKAFIEVNEEGAEAAAATAFVGTITSVSIAPPVPRFVADRPFLAAIIAGGLLHFMVTYRGKE